MNIKPAKKLVAATGTNVLSYGYDASTETLTVVHNPIGGGKSVVVNYQNVPSSLWDTHKDAHSIWIHNVVMGKFPAVAI
jgi:hypothetical protein